MALYEHVFMARQDVSAQQVEAMTENYRKIIEGAGGSIGRHEYWGVKSLAFRIKKNRKAHFTLMNLEAPHTAIAEMERQMGLSEDVLRFITIRVDEHDDQPSAMMRKREDSDGDRGDRGRGGPRGDRRPRRDDSGFGAPPAEGAQ